jgi:hypothetical protein
MKDGREEFISRTLLNKKDVETLVLYNIATCMSDYRRSFELVTGLIQNLYLITTGNYSATDVPHTL